MRDSYDERIAPGGRALPTPPYALPAILHRIRRQPEPDVPGGFLRQLHARRQAELRVDVRQMGLYGPR